MGILHSTSRFFGCQTEDDEETPIYHPYHCNGGGDSSSLRSSACSSIFKAILQGFRFLFRCWTKTPNDLPIQNSIREPLLSKPRDTDKGTPHSFYPQWQLEKQQKDRHVVLSTTTYSDAPKLRCGIVDYLSYQRLQTEKDERSRNVVLPIPGLKTPHSIEGRSSKCEIVDVLTYQKKHRDRDRDRDLVLPIPIPIPVPGSTRPPSYKVKEIASSSTVSVRKDPPRNVKKKADEKKKVRLIKNSSAIIIEEKWIKHYSNRHRILLVGDGDFSFSASLAVAFSSAANIIATSLNSEEFLKKNYFKAASNIEKLRGRGSKVMHEVDATKMANHPSLGHLKFDRIIFNFPYAGLLLKKLPRDSQLRCHKRLVDEFLKNAREMISENGEIHISHKTNSFHADFNLESIASSHRLRLIEAVRFNCSDYPGYNTKCGFGGDNNFHCYPSKTYKFGIKKLQYY